MYVCMYVCTYVGIYIRRCVYIYIYIHVYMHIHIHKSTKLHEQLLVRQPPPPRGAVPSSAKFRCYALGLPVRTPEADKRTL